MNTQRAYAADLRRFEAWGGRIPTSAEQLARYLAAHAKTLRVATLKRQLAAIAHAHDRLALPCPSRTPLVRNTLRGIRRKHGAQQKQAKALTTGALSKLVTATPHFSALQNSRDRALLLLGFAGGFRRSELCALHVGDLNFTKAGVLVRLRQGKTDQFASGRDVAIPGAANSKLCPVAALRKWLQLVKRRFTAVANELPLFGSIDRYGNIRPGLNAATVGVILRRRMEAKGLDPRGFSAHSLRAGLVTSAAQAGVPVWAIQRQTGHKSAASATKYIREVDAFRCNAAQAVL